MTEPSRSIRVEFGNFFDSLPRDRRGVSRFKVPLDKLLLSFEHRQDEEERLVLHVYLDIFREVTEDEFETTRAPIVTYVENDDEQRYTVHPHDLIPKHFYSEAHLVIPALLSQAASIHDYTTGLRRDEGQNLA